MSLVTLPGRIPALQHGSADVEDDSDPVARHHHHEGTPIMSLLTRKDREVAGTAGVVFALIAMMFGFFAFVVAAHADNKKVGAPAGAVQVSLSEFAITPASISAPLNGKLTVTNAGTAVHNFNVQGTSVHTKDLQPGDTATVDLKGLKAGSYTAFCAISGHQQLGMQATLVIGSGTGGGSSAAGMANMDFNTASPQQLAAMNDQMDATMAKAVGIYTAQLKNGPNTKGVGNQPLAPQVLTDGTKVFHLTAELANWEVSPGQHRAGLDLQRHGARTDDQGERRRPRARGPRQQAADVDGDPLPRTRGARSAWTACPTSPRRR